MTTKKQIEQGTKFIPQFSENGLIPAVVQDNNTGQIIMLAYMNKQALEATLETGYATYFSRSRKKIWKKGEKSGHFQKINHIFVDCDQDTLMLKVTVDAGQCHVGYQCCFYREINLQKPQNLQFIAEKVYQPEKTYKNTNE